MSDRTEGRMEAPGAARLSQTLFLGAMTEAERESLAGGVGPMVRRRSAPVTARTSGEVSA